MGITHPDIFACPAASPLDVHGTLVRDNPLAYIERYEMIRDSLLEFGALFSDASRRRSLVVALCVRCGAHPKDSRAVLLPAVALGRGSFCR